MAPSITERTISACNGLQISSIPKDWADHAWNSDFLESQGFPEVLENNILDCGCFVRELQELLLISRLWTTSEGQDSLNEGNLKFSHNLVYRAEWFWSEIGYFVLRQREKLKGPGTQQLPVDIYVQYERFTNNRLEISSANSLRNHLARYLGKWKRKYTLIQEWYFNFDIPYQKQNT